MVTHNFPFPFHIHQNFLSNDITEKVIKINECHIHHIPFIYVYYIEKNLFHDEERNLEVLQIM